MEPGGFVGLQGNTGRSDGEHLHFDTFMHGSYVDSYPYVFDVHENGFEGWDTFVTTGHWVCEQEKIGEVIHKERLVAVAKDNESAKNYGLVSLSIRKNDIRKQEDLNSLAEETLQAKKQIGFNRSINIAISDSNLTLLDKIKVNNVPFMNEGEEAEIVGIDFDLLNPSKDEITLDNNKFSYIGLMKGGVKS
jgi:murein DD-endopeptidase MepM/ murein hydrolase activator NlpD